MFSEPQPRSYCPRCGKKFKSATAVENHLNQPSSHCRFHYENVIHFQHSEAMPTLQPTPVQFPLFSWSPGNGLPSEAIPLDDRWMDVDESPLNGVDGPVEIEDEELQASKSIFSKPLAYAKGFFSESYPHASTTFGQGETFMDLFNSDEHAGKRQENIYYPFASKAEWELASYLLRSGLSMTAIDNFLKLELEKLPADGTLIGTILSSDKTNISSMTGGRVAHPLLISLANISMDFRNKASNHAFLLLALIPIPKFLHRNQKIRGVLEARLFHECLDLVTEPLKIAAQIGVMMADPLGFLRWCFTPLAAYIVDTPESALVSGVAGKTSSVTMADYTQFGDPFQHPPHYSWTTIDTLEELETYVNPWDLEAYEKEALKHRLNGVHRPFWHDWALSDPVLFLTSEPLHHWHKAFWDHNTKWCIYAVGGRELDFRFSILHPRVGFRHFKEGISTLKQVTGREHRDVQRYIIPVIAGAVPTPFLIAIRALLDFRYLAQARVIDEAVCDEIQAALNTFHLHKQAILDAGARRGKNGPIDNWYIPKLEFLQSVVSNIRYNGAAIQWSADTTERAHIDVVKDPVQTSNNQFYESHICRYLDRLTKLEVFDLGTAILEAGLDFRGTDTDMEDEGMDSDDDELLAVETTKELLSLIDPVRKASGSRATDYFYRATLLQKGFITASLGPLPYRTHQSTENVVFHLSRDPSFKRLEIDKVSLMFGLSDLRPAISDYIDRLASNPHENFGHITAVGGRRFAHLECSLPVTHLEVWKKVKLQTTTHHYPHDILPAATVNAAPPSDSWPHGHFDQAIFNVDQTEKWPWSGLQGHIVVDARLIFRIVLPDGPTLSNLRKSVRDAMTSRFLTYVQRYDIIPQPKELGKPSMRGQHPDPNTGLYILKRAKRTNGQLISDVMPLDQLRALADVTPRMNKTADRRWTKQNSLHYGTEFFLNKYFDKEFFYALHSR
ncbi:hypothetical protein NLJ89_g1501 [Agrocybe chaxingu]|uniref:DUF6830 domain-containing protein n=1 Tax=Agrocybe chaxingu TaxID=84603 RepID=A0A9W8MZY3_9AGAR|nr:hypothetical protein NLJ89_g1501 [Agrocybe chaxingu]